MSALTALMLNCTLKPSPEPSSTEVLGQQVMEALGEQGVSGDALRVVDHRVLPGVLTDMGDDDEWPTIRAAVLAADILVLATPTWLGQHSSVAQRVLERLDAELSETDDAGRPTLFGTVAIPVVVGNEDGAHHISAILGQALGDVGCTLAAQPAVYWNGEAMSGVDYKDLTEVPEAVAAATRTAAANAVHLAGLLAASPYPSP
ncbi:flavodoxin family protein [Microbacterium resistens]|uniref:NAD(P)H-dependent oxidoreductase n=1 Tax=Microbacterium resistens TaxID=156977 RepID=A0ABY3RSA4_9MICO|nr:NAD(P)H-dependent oxidoreductase [Microbacterium resistens]UGS25755.1 NAD(P)H-dependent oxidoreductase [Microbacterium resistens]